MLTPVTMAAFDVDAWLSAAGLSSLIEIFREEAIERLDQVVALTNEDLRDLGLKIGVRQQLLNAIAVQQAPPAAAPCQPAAWRASPPPATPPRSADQPNTAKQQPREEAFGGSSASGGAAAAIANGEVAFITLTNEGYLPYTLNCLASLERAGETVPLTMYCVDEASYDRCCRTHPRQAVPLYAEPMCAPSRRRSAGPAELPCCT